MRSLPPELLRKAGGREGSSGGTGGWRFTLHAPAFGPVMQVCRQSRAARAHVPCLRHARLRVRPARTRQCAADPWLFKLRAEEAQLLGYRNFAELSLVPKMAESPAQVLAFLREMARKARPYAEKDIAELRDFARETLGLDPMEPWDMSWVSEKLLQQRYAFSDQEVKQYFTEPRVLAGLFKVIETLFSVHVKPDTAPVWHEDVRFFRIEDAQGRLVGQFYLDLYAREEKKGGAWMNDAMGRKRTANGVQTPVAYLVCNFSRPVGEVDGKLRPATFTHDEVTTLFHETGHGLHHMLTRVEELGVSGISGVEWDAVELPSQFMENYCWEWDVLQGMTAHVDTGRPLAARTVRQDAGGEEFPRRHADGAPDRVLSFRPAAAQRLRPGCRRRRSHRAAVAGSSRNGRGGFPARLAPLPEQLLAHLRRRLCGGRLLSGPEVLSADCYAAFEEAGNPSTRKPGAVSSTRSWPSAAYARRSIPSAPSVAAN